MSANLSARDRLAADHVQLVAPIARRILAKLPKAFELEDLKSAGVIGLLEAAATYDAAKGPFTAWARCKIRAAIVASVRGNAYEYAQRRSDLPASEPPADVPLEYEDPPADPLLELLPEAMKTLTPRERMLLEMVYKQELTLRAIGRGHLLGPPLVVKSGRRGAPVTVGSFHTVVREYDHALAKLRTALLAMISRAA